MTERAKAATAMAVFAACSAWVVAASWIYCSLTGNMGLFGFPWAQWIEAASWWPDLAWLTRAYLIGSAVVPSLVLLVVGRVAYELAKPKREIYGRSEFADGAAMKRGGVKVSRRL